MTQPASTFALLFISFSIAIAAFTLPATGQTSPTISVYDGFEPVTQHQLGNHLYVIVDEGRPDTDYTARLVDETGFLVATQDLKTDEQGWGEPELLWHRSGIIGCRDDEAPNPYTYRFRDYSEAESLGGRTFTLQLLNSAGRVEAAASIPFVVDPTPRYYFSDSTGCPTKQHDPADTLWLTGTHLDPTTPTTLNVWLVSTPQVWFNESPMVDVRPNYQESGQLVTFSGTQSQETLPIAEFEDEGYCIWGTIQAPGTTTNPDPEPDPGSDPSGSESGSESGSSSGSSSESVPLQFTPNLTLDPFMETSTASGPLEVGTQPDTPVAGPISTVYGSCPPCEECTAQAGISSQ